MPEREVVQVMHTFTLGDLGSHDGYAVGTVEEINERVVVTLKKAIVWLPDPFIFENGEPFTYAWQITHLLCNDTRSTLETKIRDRWRRALPSIVDEYTETEERA